MSELTDTPTMKEENNTQTAVKKPVVRKELLFPFIIITSLFALWGIANDLTNPMVSAFKKVMPELTNVQASLVQVAFYFGYFCLAFQQHCSLENTAISQESF